MADLIPNAYPNPGTGAIASYNYFDLAEARGYKVFYGFSSRKSDAYLTSGSPVTTYGLSETAIYSNDILTSGSVIGPGAYPAVALSLDLDFDLVFNRPQNVDGPMKIVNSYGVRADTNTISGSMHYNIYKYNGSTETLLTSGGTVMLDFGGGKAGARTTKTLIIDVPNTHFSSGDTLRVNAQGWVSGVDGSANGKVILAHDPKDRGGAYIDPANDASDTTILEVHVPFRIDAEA